MIDYYYTAFSVLNDYLKKNDYSVQNINMQKQAPDRVILWVETNTNAITHFVCIKMSMSQFLIWGYGEDGSEKISTSIDYEKPSI